MKHLYTVGHSTRDLEDFFDILKEYGITHLMDVRTIPKSRKFPWFNQSDLRRSCQENGVIYEHMPKLGGLRKADKDSENTAWRNASFRGFADYMQTAAFYEGLKHLNSYLARGHEVCIMCAEAVPWRCHRSLISDAELARRIKVLHITGKRSLHEHKLTAFAKILPHTKPMKIIYPGQLSMDL